MEFLDKLVIPQPDYNLNLLSILLIAGLMIFLTYTGVLFGSLLLSYIYKPSESKPKDIGSIFARDMANLVTKNFSYLFGIGLIPFLSIIFLYAQLLHKEDTAVVGYLVASFILYLIATILIFRYKNSFHVSNLLTKLTNNYDGEDYEKHELKEYTDNLNSSKNSSGLYGIIAMFFSMWIFVGAVALAVNSARWEEVTNIFWLMIAPETLLRFAHFLTAALTITGLSFLFQYFYWDKAIFHRTDEYKSYSRDISLKAALIFGAFQPVFFLLNLFTLPGDAVNAFVFGASIIGVFLIFMVLNLTYIMFKNKQTNYAFSAFTLFLIVFGLMAMKENTAFKVSNQEHVVALNKDYKVYKEELLAKAGRNVEEVIDGGEIYNGRCIACHKFDEKLVGPPHKEVLPKYVENKEALVDFILNPVKVNPDYPPMPNQGLKRKEAEAVADYMLSEYGPKL